jgi:hypothetical protein
LAPFQANSHGFAKCFPNGRPDYSTNGNNN